MKIFITGSTGFVGSHLVDFYEQQGHEVCGFNRNQDLLTELSRFAPDIIINSAAEIYDYEHMFEPNILMVQVILEYTKIGRAHV